jgi:dTDP-4-dehydrorhamnose 3,5-epimerase
MRLPPERLKGLVLLTAATFPDERGYVLQSWVGQILEQAGIPARFGQAIQTVSRRGVLRGIHFQWQPLMGKLVRCVRGAILELSGENRQIIWVPPGFAHATFALEDDTIVLYECSSEHGVGNEGGILWNDPALGIAWPDIPAIVSAKDRVAPTLAAWLADPRSRHFQYA